MQITTKVESCNVHKIPEFLLCLEAMLSAFNSCFKLWRRTCPRCSKEIESYDYMSSLKLPQIQSEGHKNVSSRNYNLRIQRRIEIFSYL